MLRMAATTKHLPVLLDELIAGLAVKQGGLYADCTLGGGGHAEAVLEASAPGGRLLGLDLDERAVPRVEQRLARFAGSLVVAKGNFADLSDIAAEQGFSDVDGIYFDLGLSSLQLEEPGRGFSFHQDDPLDMRFDPQGHRTASNLVNKAAVEDLAQVLRNYGEEPRSRAIARRIERARPVHSTGELAQLVQQAAPGHRQRIHPATRTFQALRMWVNDESANLERALPQSLDLLKSGGRVAVISFHSLEDRAVKTYFAQESKDCICPPVVPVCVCGHTASIRLVSKKVITPSPEETERNPRSRSAKLRIAQKL